jgi:hypothetical protein
MSLLMSLCSITNSMLRQHRVIVLFFNHLYRYILHHVCILHLRSLIRRTLFHHIHTLYLHHMDIHHIHTLHLRSLVQHTLMFHQHIHTLHLCYIHTLHLNIFTLEVVNTQDGWETPPKQPKLRQWAIKEISGPVRRGKFGRFQFHLFVLVLLTIILYLQFGSSSLFFCWCIP